MRSIWEIVELLDHLFEHYCIEESAKLRLVELCGYWWERFDPEECGESNENVVTLLKVLKSNDRVVIKGCKTGKVEIDTEFLVSSICDALPISQKQGYYKSKNGISDDVPEEDWEKGFWDWYFKLSERNTKDYISFLKQFNPVQNKWKPMLGLLSKEIIKVVDTLEWEGVGKRNEFVYDLLEVFYPQLLTSVDVTKDDKYRYINSSIKSFETLPKEDLWKVDAYVFDFGVSPKHEDIPDSWLEKFYRME